MKPSLSSKEQAIDWVARLELEGPAAEAELREWLQRDALNVEAFRNAMARAISLDRAILARHRTADAGRKFVRAHAVSQEPLRVFGLLLPLVVLVMAWFFLSHQEGVVYETAVGEHRQIIFSDGTSVELSTSSRIRVPPWRESREVRLEKGQVLLHVAPDSERPFKIGAGAYVAETADARFAIQQFEPRGFAITVTDGSVLVSKGETGDPTSVRAGERAVATSNSRNVTVVGQRDDARVLVWRAHSLSVSDATVADIVRGLNRYSSRRIVIRDWWIGEVRMSGKFYTGDEESFVKALSLTSRVGYTMTEEEIELFDLDAKR